MTTVILARSRPTGLGHLRLARSYIDKSMLLGGESAEHHGYASELALQILDAGGTAEELLPSFAAAARLKGSESDSAQLQSNCAELALRLLHRADTLESLAEAHNVLQARLDAALAFRQTLDPLQTVSW